LGVNNYTYGKDGTSLTEGFESCALTAYRDIRGIWTVGWGHTGPDVYEGVTITAEQAQLFFEADIQWAQNTVNRIVTIPISQDENDALVDWVFNVGCGAAAGSTLIRDLNAGQIEQAAAQFDAWDHASGQVVAGLLRRRQAETALFEQGEQPTSA
jgi:lysozyme